mgnify:CR=1 FL=1
MQLYSLEIVYHILCEYVALDDKKWVLFEQPKIQGIAIRNKTVRIEED